jgi:hypothetical protein
MLRFCPLQDMQELCTNITYLGKHGVASLHGLRIGFISGYFTDAAEGEVASTDAQKDAEEAKRTLVNKLAALTSQDEPAAATGQSEGDGGGFAGVDALFTNQWPRGVTAALELPGGAGAGAAAPPPRNPTRSSGTVTVAAVMLRPRYHFAASEGVAWSRAPYSSQCAAHATRFVALAPVKMTKAAPAEKFLHALKISPMAGMGAAALGAVPPGTTRDPFASISAGLVKPGGAGGGGVKRVHDGDDAAGSKRPALGAGSSAGGGALGCRVYINNLSYKCTEQQLAEFFGAVGEVGNISIATSREDGRPRE